jgi:hypothetical protein
MVRRTLITLLAALAATSTLATGPAAAQRGGFGSQWDNGQEDKRKQLGSVLRDLRSQYGGRHLDAQDAGSRYIISWITEDGRRLTIVVDASTGRTISVRGG